MTINIKNLFRLTKFSLSALAGTALLAHTAFAQKPNAAFLALIPNPSLDDFKAANISACLTLMKSEGDDQTLLGATTTKMMCMKTIKLSDHKPLCSVQNPLISISWDTNNILVLRYDVATPAPDTKASVLVTINPQNVIYEASKRVISHFLHSPGHSESDLMIEPMPQYTLPAAIKRILPEIRSIEGQCLPTG